MKYGWRTGSRSQGKVSIFRKPLQQDRNFGPAVFRVPVSPLKVESLLILVRKTDMNLGLRKPWEPNSPKWLSYVPGALANVLELLPRCCLQWGESSVMGSQNPAQACPATHPPTGRTPNLVLLILLFSPGLSHTAPRLALPTMELWCPQSARQRTSVGSKWKYRVFWELSLSEYSDTCMNFSSFSQVCKKLCTHRFCFL